MRIRIVVPAVLCLLLSALPAFGQQFSSLEERMSGADFKAAGLDKLSPEELKYLDNWLQTHQPVKMVSPSGKPVFYADEDSKEFETHLVGTFSGLSARSRAELGLEKTYRFSSFRGRAKRATRNLVVRKQIPGSVSCVNGARNDGRYTPSRFASSSALFSRFGDTASAVPSSCANSETRHSSISQRRRSMASPVAPLARAFSHSRQYGSTCSMRDWSRAGSPRNFSARSRIARR